MNAFLILESFFHVVVWMSPAAAIVIALVLLTRKLMGNRQDPRIFYFLWIALTVRLLIPWFPSGEFGLWSVAPSLPESFDHFANREPVLLQLHPQQSEIALTGEQEPRVAWMAAAFWIWLIGAFGILAFFLVLHGKLYFSIKRQSMPVGQMNKDLHMILDRCKRKLNIRYPVQLRLHALVSSPAAYGWYKPRILIPCDMPGKLNEQEWGCIFMHELTHIRRKDAFWNGLMIVLVALHWFNPLVWKACFKMREDQELSCDAAVSNYCNAIQYGHTLTKVMEIRSGIGQFSAISFHSGKVSIAKRRVEMLLTRKRTLLSVLMAICIALVAAWALTNSHLHANTASSGQAGKFAIPADGAITSHFGEETKHNVYAISIANQAGTPVYATADGKILQAGYASGGDGFRIVVAHADSYESVYNHLEEITVSEGQKVRKGQQIGTMGSTGKSTGPHLSFEIMKNGQFLDPEELLYR